MVLLTAPASLLAVFLQLSLPGLWLNDVKGSLWRGEAGHAVVEIHGGTLSLGKVRWSISPLSLLWLSPSLHLNAEKPGQSIVFYATLYPTGGVKLTDVRGEFPLAVIEQWAPLLIDGHVFFNLPLLEASASEIKKLQGAVNLREVAWVGGDTIMPFGNYQANVAMSSGEVNVKLRDHDAKLALQGEVSALLSGQYQMDLQLTERAGLNPAVIKSLAWLGKRQGSEVIIRRQGDWR